MIQTRELPPIKETTDDYDAIEKRIVAAFRQMLYLPLIKILKAPKSAIANAAKNPIMEAIESGRVYTQTGPVYGGTIPSIEFFGTFSAEITKALKALGAKWTKRGTFVIRQQSVTSDFVQAVAAAGRKSLERVAEVDAHLKKNLPAEIADSIKTSDLIDSSLWKTDRDLRKTLKQITVLPQVSTEARQKIADEWSTNLDLWIKDFTAEEILKLRKQIQAHAFSGNRYEDIVSSIKRSYGVTQAKAKFLARQETSLLLTKFKETRYTEAGINEYKWGCVAGSKNHPVRPSHKILEGKVFRWDAPPITTEPGEPTRRNNPGQDYNCRCYAKPIVKFRKD